MASRTLVSSLPRSLPPLPPGPASTYFPCVEGRQRAAPHSSEFPLTEAPLQTLHMDVWGPARIRGQGHELYFLLVVDDYSRYTTVFPLRSKGEVTEVLIDWIRDRGGEFSSNLLRAYFCAEGIRQTFTLPASPQQNGIAERRIGMVMDVTRTSMIHAAAPHFLWSFAVQYAAHQINLQPRFSLPETTPTLRWTGKVGDASVLRVCGSRAFVRDTSADKLSSRAVPCVFLVFPLDATRWQFYHPTSRHVLSCQDVTFDKSVSYYRLFPYRTAPLPPPPLFLAPGAPPVDLLPPQGPAPSGVSQVDPVEPLEPGGAESGGAKPGGAEPGGAEPERAESGGPPGVPSQREPLSPQRLREWYAWRCSRAAGATAAGPGGTGTVGGPGGARTGGTRAARAGGAAGTGATGGTGAGGAAGVGAVGAGAVLLEVLLELELLEVLELVLQPASHLHGPSPYSGPTRGLMEHRKPESCPTSLESRPASPESRPASPEFRLASPVCAVCTSRRVPQTDSLRTASPVFTRLLATIVTNPSFESTAASALVAELVDFVAHCRLDYAASLVAESESASVCPPSVRGECAHRHLDYATALVAESESTSPPFDRGECALGTDVLENKQEDFECLAPAVPHLVSMLLALEGDPNAPDILTPRSCAEAIEGPYSSQWQAAMDAEMASWKSTGTYVDEVPPPGANIVSGMSIFRVKQPTGSPPVFKARDVARGFSQRQGVDFFQTFSPTSKMTTLRVLLHVAAQRDYELHSLDFSTSFLQGSLHEEIWLRRPPGFTGSFPAGTQWSLRRPVYGLRKAPREWHNTLRTTLAALGFVPSTSDPSLFLRTDATLPLFYVLVYVDDLVFATVDTEALAHVNSEMQKRHTCNDLVQQVLQRFGFTYSLPQSTPLPTGHSLSAPPSDESVEPSGPYPDLMGCLMYLMTCTRPELAHPLSLLARYVAPDASWVDDLATQRSSQGYTFSLGSSSVSWRSTRSSFVLSSSCEAEIYARAMAAQELRWLTYLLTDLGEAPRSPPVLYVDNKAMLALCQEHSLEHRTKHIALRYFLARELQQRGQLCLAYVASRANTADVFTKALQPCDHQCFCTILGLVPTVPHLLTP
ncbi:unnamed protein product [Closterium sp. NIES-53]